MISQKNHIEQGLGRLPSQFSGKENIEGVLSAYLGNLQLIEDDLLSLLGGTSIDESSGALLDNLGKIVGEYRLGKSNGAYREAIKLKILLNSAEGTPDVLLEILQLVTDAAKVSIHQHFPLSCTFRTDGTIPKNLPKILTESSPITSEEVVIAHDPNNKAFTPCERDTTLAILIDNNDNEVIDDQGNNIAVGIASGQGQSNLRGKLIERGADPEGYGTLAEAFR